MSFENNSFENQEGLINNTDAELIKFLGEDIFNAVENIIPNKELFFSILKNGENGKNLLSAIKENILESPIGLEIDEDIFLKIINQYEKLKNKYESITKDSELVYDFLKEKDIYIGKIQKLNTYLDKIESKTGKKFSELFSNEEFDKAKIELEKSGIDKSDDNYEVRLKSILINKHSDRLLLEYPEIKDDINIIKNITKDVFPDINELTIPLHSKQQIIHSNTEKGGFTKSGNTLINGNQIFIVDSKTGEVSKYLSMKDSDYLIDVTIELPTDYAYKREREKIQKETKQLAIQYYKYDSEIKEIQTEIKDKINEINTLNPNIEGNLEKIEMIKLEIDELKQEEKIRTNKVKKISEKIKKLIDRGKKIEKLESNRILIFKEAQKNKDEKTKKTLQFLQSIGFDLIPQKITDQIITNLNSNNGLRNLLGFNEEINLSEGSLGIQKDNDKNNIGIKEKVIFTEFVNIMISGNKNGPINVLAIEQGSGVGISDKSKFKSILNNKGVNGTNGNIIINNNINNFLKTKPVSN